MPYKCCVPGCKGNYNSTRQQVSVFSFPKDQELKKKWLKAICRINFPSSSTARVCEDHFRPVDVERVTSYYDERTGRLLTAKLLIPRLAEGAVPSQLLGLPTSRRAVPDKKGGSNRSRKKLATVFTDSSDNDRDISAEPTAPALSSSILLEVKEEQECQKTPVRCCAIDCKNRHKKDSGITFYRFPLKNESQLAKWTASLSRENFVPTKFSALCSEHFEPTCFRICNGRRHLKARQVPTIFDHPVPPQEPCSPARLALPKDTVRPEASVKNHPKKKLLESDDQDSEKSLRSVETLSSASLPHIKMMQISPDVPTVPSYQSYPLYKASMSTNGTLTLQGHSPKSYHQLTQQSIIKKKISEHRQQELSAELLEMKKKYEQKCKQNVNLRKRLKLAQQRIRRLNKTLTDLASAIEGLDDDDDLLIDVDMST